MTRVAVVSGAIVVMSASLVVAACGSDPVATPAPTDAGLDAETSIPTDSGPRDAQPEAAPSVFCKGLTVDFCGEFGGPTPGAGWDGVDARGGGAVALAAATETSAPSVLSSKLPAIATGSNAANAQVAKKLSLGGKKKITLSLAANFGSAPPSAGGSVTYFYVLIDGGGIALLRRDTGWFLRVSRKNAGGDDGAELAVTSAPPLAKWARLKLEVTLANPAGSLRLDVDGAQALTQTLATHGDAQPLAEVTLATGLTHGSGAIPAMDVAIDDVTLDLE
ncbi:MAG: hypothetical protein JST00_21390 [Deltaproteobacteria bacterium]|nr:hypothetical protein [Deltaproteobacteria bacterium]